MALLWVLSRWVYAGYVVDFDIQQGRTFGVFLNLFFILSLVGIGMFVFRKTESDGGIFGSFRRIVRYPLVYTFFVTIGMFLYYSYITDEVQIKRSKDMAQLDQLLSDPIEVEKLMLENEALKGKSINEIKELGASKINSMTSPKVMTSLGFLMLSLSSVTYSILALLLARLVLKR